MGTALGSRVAQRALFRGHDCALVQTFASTADLGGLADGPQQLSKSCVYTQNPGQASMSVIVI